MTISEPGLSSKLVTAFCNSVGSESGRVPFPGEDPWSTADAERAKAHATSRREPFGLIVTACSSSSSSSSRDRQCAMLEAMCLAWAIAGELDFPAAVKEVEIRQRKQVTTGRLAHSPDTQLKKDRPDLRAADPNGA